MLLGMLKAKNKESIEHFFDEEIPKLSYDLKKMVIEYGIPFDVLYSAMVTKKKKDQKMERKLAQEASFMQKFYEDDPELTELTLKMESEEFHEY
ncbi:MAG: hypothetical protein CIT03_07500 [Methanobacterium sp.]|nr:MAG: hypothetical protein CIT03_07500 [Methanobacterium sp.]